MTATCQHVFRLLAHCVEIYDPGGHKKPNPNFCFFVFSKIRTHSLIILVGDINDIGTKLHSALLRFDDWELNKHTISLAYARTSLTTLQLKWS